MKRLLLLFILLIPALASAQVSSSNARRIRSGTAVPTHNCSPGPSYTDVYIRTTTDVHYTCTSTNTWTPNAGVTAGAPTDATYITQTANGSLSAEQALSALSSGIMRVATTTGVITSLTDSAGMATNISDETGTNKLVFSDSPSLVTPTLGVASATKLTTAAGSVAAPSLVVGTDATTGFFSAGANEIGLTTASTYMWRFVGLPPALIGASDAYLAWTFGTPANAIDTTLSRNGAGALQFGTTGANASGSWLAVAGTLSSATAPITFSNAAYQSCAGFTSTAGGVLTCTPSTAKVKQGFQFFDRGLDVIRRIQPQTFQYRAGTPLDDGYKTHLGLVAENLKAADPLLASETKAGMLQPELMAIAAIQIAAIKELDARLSRLERENKLLRARLNRRLNSLPR